MRKLVFSALACVAFAGSGFASNEVVKNEITSDENFQIENSTEIINSVESDTKPCRFRIIGRDAFGRSFDTTWETTSNTTEGGCGKAKDAKVKELQDQEATIDKTIVVWG